MKKWICVYVLLLLVLASVFVTRHQDSTTEYTYMQHTDCGYTLYVGECYSQLLPKRGYNLTQSRPGWKVKDITTSVQVELAPNPGITRVICMAGGADRVLRPRKPLAVVRAECIELGKVLEEMYQCPVDVLDPEIIEKLVTQGKLQDKSLLTDTVHLSTKGYDRLKLLTRDKSAWLKNPTGLPIF